MPGGKLDGKSFGSTLPGPPPRSPGTGSDGFSPWPLGPGIKAPRVTEVAGRVPHHRRKTGIHLLEAGRSYFYFVTYDLLFKVLLSTLLHSDPKRYG